MVAVAPRFPRAHVINRILLGVISALAIEGLPASAQSQSISQARITNILDGNQVYIQNRLVGVNSVAQRGQQVRTGQSRAELRFDTNAVGRLSPNAALVVGQDCVRVNQGTLLVSGPGNSCSRQVVAGVRGTIYTLAVEPDGTTTITVLEGAIEATLIDPSLDNQEDLERRLPTSTPKGLEPLQCRLEQKQEGQTISCGSIPMAAGLQITVDATGQLQTIRPLSSTEFAAVLGGPLMTGFSQPLPRQPSLQQSFEQLYPTVPFPGFPAPDLNNSSLDEPDASADPVCEQTLDAYRQSIRSLAEVDWMPPRPPTRGVWQTVLVYSVTSTGMVQNIAIQQSSGYSPFDDSAVRSAQSNTFPPLPDCFTGNLLNITHRFELIYQ